MNESERVLSQLLQLVADRNRALSRVLDILDALNRKDRGKRLREIYKVNKQAPPST